MDGISIKAKRNRWRIWSAAVAILLIGMACSLGQSQNNANQPVESTATLKAGSAAQADAPTQEVAAPQTVSVLRVDGSEEQILYQITSYAALLRQKMESGEWTEAEGLIQLLRLFTGEISQAEVPGSEIVLAQGGTGIVRWAEDYINADGSNPEDVAEMERLLAKIFPTADMLDQISVPSGETGSLSAVHLAKPATQATETSCQTLASQGFDSKYYDGDHCYVYDEAQVNGHKYRVYYPTWWQGQDDKKTIIDSALLALVDSAATFNAFGTFEDVNLMVSMLPYPDDTETSVTDALQSFTPAGSACPLTVFPDSASTGMDYFKQTIAHEAFHCFQDWNFNTVPYDPNAWWLEGSAEFFSNVVYPSNNAEYGFLGQFDTASVNSSLQQMDYENFIFFQYAANHYTESGVIDLLNKLGNASGSAATLAGHDNMDAVFQEFVVAYMSTGVADTGGGFIKVAVPSVTRTETVDEEGEESFTTSAFVASRYTLKYKQEKRFLQTPSAEGTGKHSAAKYILRVDPSKWSDIPPEIRSTCDDDLLYSLVVTTTDTGSAFTQKINVDEVQDAECDPCLLGVWEVDNDSFEQFILGIIENQGGIPNMPGGAELILEITGSNYVEFLEEGDLTTRRDAYTISIGITGYTTFDTVIDSQGTATYTADGETMEVTNAVDYVNSIQASVSGVPISINQTPGASTYNFFGTTASGPGLDPSDGPQETSGSYVCTEETLTLDQEAYGELLFNRVEKILPTPVPTASP